MDSPEPTAPGQGPVPSPVLPLPNGVTSASDSWVASGPSSPNQVYLGARLQYRDEVDDSMSGVVSAELAAATLKRTALVWLILFLGALLVGSAYLAMTQELGSIIPVAILFTILAWIYPFLPMRLPLKEWHLLLDGRAQNADTAFFHIKEALLRRATPVSARPVRMRTPHAAPGVRHRVYLDVVYGRFRTTIGVFGYGEDLYIGWTSWWRISPFRIWLSFLGQVVVGAFDPRSAFNWVVRSDDVKAFKEAIHAATREGVDASNYAPTPDIQHEIQQIPETPFPDKDDTLPTL